MPASCAAAAVTKRTADDQLFSFVGPIGRRGRIADGRMRFLVRIIMPFKALEFSDDLLARREIGVGEPRRSARY